MANDATIKSTPNSDSLESTSLSNAGDQQKVPPLRIVLNSAGNQKSSTSTATGNQQTSTKRSQDARQEGNLKSGGRVRIKLGTNKQQNAKGSINNETNDVSVRTDNQRTREKTNDKQLENLNEDSTSSFTHLRRITRRSQRTVQSINNEDEESISSMTSVDENTTSNIQPNSDTAQDLEQSNTATTASSANTTNNATNGSSNQDTPRRYKRKKIDSSESQNLECDSLLGTQNYKLPHQNSFELYKNIRKQVDKKLKSLTCVHPKVPYGFRDYMLSRGAYLLDGNKLGNGTNVFTNEQGYIDPAPVGKYHLLKFSRTNYSVPDRAKVPLGLPVNSPLYDLFIEQEKERYRMRIQHIKEREKLTLAAEQEFIRVYNQAALAAVNQTETFSVCTMLKHQEMYNYLDSDGATILSREDAQQDQAEQTEGVRTRRRQHGQISPAPTRKGSNQEESSTGQETTSKELENPTSSNDEKKQDTNKPTDSSDKDGRSSQDGDSVKPQEPEAALATVSMESDGEKTEDVEKKSPTNQTSTDSDDNTTKKEKSENDDKAQVSKDSGPSESKMDDHDDKQDLTNLQNQSSDVQKCNELKNPTSDVSDDVAMLQNDNNPVESITDEEKKAINKEKFLIHLQEVDDKWDRIRHEMLIRHKNEAESLYAIQKLEWEWKTKEIGACDVRTPLFIDDTLVPKLNIYSQDY